jgi:transcriptional regulator with XRE-family HTH domain
MPRTVSPLLPATLERLRQLGERLRLARRRRRLSATQVAARAGMAPMTLRGVERGAPAATMGAYVAVMQVLGVDEDLDLLAAADPTGRALQDARLSRPRPPQDRRRPASAAAPSRTPPTTTAPARDAAASSLAAAAQRAAPGVSKTGVPTTPAAGFVTARALATLLDTPTRSRVNTKRR